MSEQFIVHIDMDAFFASVEQRDNPSLRGKAVIVGADPKGGKGRGVVSTCSYEARKFGIHSAMPISEAFRKCPQAVFLPVDIEKYSKVSEEIFDIFYNFTPEVEPVSIDEAFLDITTSYHLFGTPLETCRLIKRKIKEKTGLTASLGLAPTKMVAKIASDLSKPDGLLEITREKLKDFLWPLDVGKLWGIGPATRNTLKTAGINTIGELARMDVKKLVEILGRRGLYFWNLAQGIDKSKIEKERIVKSVSKEITFEKDTVDIRQIYSSLAFISDRVSERLRREGVQGKTITLKIRFNNFQTNYRSITIPEATNFADDIYRYVKRLYNETTDIRKRKIRLLGIKISGFSEVRDNGTLFNENEDTKKERIHQAVEKIRSKFGRDIIVRAILK